MEGVEALPLEPNPLAFDASVTPASRACANGLQRCRQLNPTAVPISTLPKGSGAPRARNTSSRGSAGWRQRRRTTAATLLPAPEPKHYCSLQIDNETCGKQAEMQEFAEPAPSTALQYASSAGPQSPGARGSLQILQLAHFGSRLISAAWEASSLLGPWEWLLEEKRPDAAATMWRWASRE